MEREDLKRLARAWFDDVLNNRNLDAIDERFAEDIVYRANGRSPTIGKATYRRVAEMLLNASTDRRATVEEQLVDGNRVVTRWSSEGTHDTGPMFGIPPTGRRFHVSGVVISRIEGGSIAEECEYNDVPLLIARLRGEP